MGGFTETVNDTDFAVYDSDGTVINLREKLHLVEGLDEDVMSRYQTDYEDETDHEGGIDPGEYLPKIVSKIQTRNIYN